MSKWIAVAGLLFVACNKDSEGTRTYYPLLTVAGFEVATDAKKGDGVNVMVRLPQYRASGSQTGTRSHLVSKAKLLETKNSKILRLTLQARIPEDTVGTPVGTSLVAAFFPAEPGTYELNVEAVYSALDGWPKEPTSIGSWTIVIEPSGKKRVTATKIGTP